MGKYLQYGSNKKITIPNISRTQMKQIKKDKQYNRILKMDKRLNQAF